MTTQIDVSTEIFAPEGLAALRVTRRSPRHMSRVFEPHTVSVAEMFEGVVDQGDLVDQVSEMLADVPIEDSLLCWLLTMDTAAFYRSLPEWGEVIARRGSGV